VTETLISYYPADPHHVGEDLRDMADHGCTGIVLCVTEVDVRRAPGRLNAVFKEAPRAGIDIYVNFWSLGNLFATDVFPSEYVWRHPEVSQLVLPATRSRLEGAADEYALIPRACFRNPDFRAYAEEYVTEFLKQHRAKGVFWDEPRSHYCCCEHCREWFRERFGEEMPGDVTAQMVESRLDLLRDCLEDLSGTVKALDGSLVNMLCLMPPTSADRDEEYFDRLSGIEHMDNLGTDPYWRHSGHDAAWVSASVRQIVRLARKHGKKSHAWIQCFALPKGAESEVGETADLVGREGVDIVAAWGYRGEAGTYQPCGDPHEVWRQLGRAFRRMRGVRDGACLLSERHGGRQRSTERRRT